MQPTTERVLTDWLRVALLVSAGIAAAAHIGKVPGALPVLAAELKLDLGTSALLTSIYSLVAATCGLAFGLTAQRFGPLRLVVGGLLLSSAASLLGAVSQGAIVLLASRVIEGLGFIMAVVAVPTLIIGATRAADRPVAMGIWGSYVPAGSSLMMLATAFTLAPLGWRGVWGLAAAASGLCALAVWFGMAHQRQSAAAAPVEALPWRVAVREALEPQSLLLAGCFMAYGAQYLAVTSFLPLMLVERLSVPVAAAGLMGAGVAASNIIGNVGSGWLAGRGWTARRVITVAALGMAASSIPVFADGVPLALRVSAAMIFTGIGGLIPGTLLGSAPQVARTPHAVAGVVGLMIQGAGVGQLLGPPFFAACVGWAGSWQGAWAFTALAGAVLLICASLLAKSARTYAT